MQDETVLIWHSGREEKKLWLNTVSRIIPGQHTVSTWPSLSGIPLFAEPSLNFQSYCWFLQFLNYCGDLACRLRRIAHMSFLATGYFSALPAARQGVSVIFSDSGQWGVLTWCGKLSASDCHPTFQQLLSLGQLIVNLICYQNGQTGLSCWLSGTSFPQMSAHLNVLCRFARIKKRLKYGFLALRPWSLVLECGNQGLMGGLTQFLMPTALLLEHEKVLHWPHHWEVVTACIR